LQDDSLIHENLVEKNGKIRCFGAINTTELTLEPLTTLFQKHRTCTYLLVIPEGVLLDELLVTGWDSSYSFDEAIIRYALLKKGAVVKAVGEFDDIETGLVTLGYSKVIKLLS
jgi:hypothetical protein